MKFTYKNIHNPKKLSLLLKQFLKDLKKKNSNLHSYVVRNIYAKPEFGEKYGNENEELVKVALEVEKFILKFAPKQFFKSYCNLQNKLKKENNIFIFRKNFINKYVKTYSLDNLKNIDFNEIKLRFFNNLNIKEFDEEIIINKVLKYLENTKKNEHKLNIAISYCAYVWNNINNLPEIPNNQTIFFKALKTDFTNLIQTEINKNGNKFLKASIFRDNFNCYHNIETKFALHNNNYCVKCHKRDKDNCRKGETIKLNNLSHVYSHQENTIEVKKPEFLSNDNKQQNNKTADSNNKTFYQKNPLNIKLEGCPLGMHISQMHILAEQHALLAALCVITINNPLVASTGFSICNDCKVSCIFQKQTTVDTPYSETFILQTILELPYGFEIYNFLTLWNPLRFYRPIPSLNYQNHNILVVGSGPAGFSLAYNLLQEGYGVCILETLPILPINNIRELIVNINSHTTNLENRNISGFGGVAEYGITSRWNKNYLIIIRIILERYKRLILQGSTRFGGMINFNNAKSLGFSHIALCTGAGKPNIIPSLTGKGIRTSSEFLMSLELGAFQKNSNFNMQIRFPCVVLGAGLTAVDCATELFIYYQRLLEKIVPKYLSLKKKLGESNVLKHLDEEEKNTLSEYTKHYNLLQGKSSKQKLKILQELGGVKIIYQKSMQECSAYKNNYVELENALKQGVEFVENAKIKTPIFDKNGWVDGLNLEINKKHKILPTKCIITAFGTNYNNSTLEEYKDLFSEQEKNLNPNNNYSFYFKGKKTSVYLTKLQDDVAVTFFGDTNKYFHGSVVKAISSAFYGYKTIIKLINDITAMKPNSRFKKIFENNYLFTKKLAFNFWKHNFLKKTRIKFRVNKAVADNLHQLSIKSQLISQNFKMGMCFKIQNIPTPSHLMLEPLVFTGVIHDKKKNIIKGYLKDIGTSSHNASRIYAKNISINGPLCDEIYIPKNKNVLLIGENVYNNSILSILELLKKHNNYVTYIADFKEKNQIVGLDIIKKYTDKAIVIFNNINSLKQKHNNILFTNQNIIKTLEKNITDCMNYCFISCGSNIVEDLYYTINKYLEKAPQIINLHSIMNCASKGICATCIQKHNINNNENIVYTCVKQNQNFKTMDLNFYKNKLKQNSLQEIISRLNNINNIN